MYFLLRTTSATLVSRKDLLSTDPTCQPLSAPLLALPSRPVPAAEPGGGHAHGAEDAQQEHRAHAGEGARPRQLRAAHPRRVLPEEAQHLHGE